MIGRVRATISGAMSTAPLVLPDPRFSGLSVQHLKLAALLGRDRSLRGVRGIGLNARAAEKHLRELEAMFGVLLFERGADGGFVPTAAAGPLVDFARQALANVRDSAAAVSALAHGSSIALRLGSVIGVPRTLVAHALAARDAGAGGARDAGDARPPVELRDGFAAELLQRLLANELDAAIVEPGRMLPSPEAGYEPLGQQSFALVASRGVRDGGARLPSDLARMPWVLPPRGDPLREHVDSVFTAAGLAPPRVAVEAGTPGAVVEILFAGDAFVAALPQVNARRLVAGGVLTPLDSLLRLPPIGYGVAVARHRREPATLRALLAEVRVAHAERERAERSGRTHRLIG